MTREAQIVASLSSGELLESLENMVAQRKLTIPEAAKVYTRSRRQRMLAEAKQEVLRAVDSLIVHHVRGVGQQRTEESETEERSGRQWLEDSLDGLVQAAERAILTKWRLETKSSEAKSIDAANSSQGGEST